MEIKQLDSWAGVDQLVIVPLVTHGSVGICSHIPMFSVFHWPFLKLLLNYLTMNMLLFVYVCIFQEFHDWWLHKSWKQENKIAEMTNYFIVKNLKTHTLHSHWTGVYVTDKPQQFYMATHSAWFSQKESTQIHQTRILGIRGTKTCIFLGQNND